MWTLLGLVEFMSQRELGLLAEEENRKDFQYGYDEEVSCQKEARSVAVL